jgi:2-dehydro-3-deoxygalactonokinase
LTAAGTQPPLARRTALIAVDWGTTSARAYRVDASGAIQDARHVALGILQVRDNAFAAALMTLLGDWAGEAVPRLACGMIGSRQGWLEAPYADCPATLDALAGRIVRTSDGALAIVPGLACRDLQGVPDVMRGEETQIVGALDDDGTPALFVLPGTHSKWAIVRAGRIEAFSTCMTGEVYAVLKDHSILGRMIAPAGQPFAAGAFGRGTRNALNGSGPGALLHDLFGARTLALFGELPPDEVADYLSGLLIGNEIAAGRQWATKRGGSERVTLVGAPALCARYSVALAIAGIAVSEGPADAAARGLWRIAQHAGLVR